MTTPTTSPMTEAAQPAVPGQTAPDPVNLLFGFRGRIGRGRYWVGIGVVVGFLLLTMVFLAMGMSPTGGGGLEALAFPALLAALWVHAAVTVKRLRDMGYSAWLYLGLIAVFAGALFVGIEAAEATRGLSLLFLALVLAIPGLAQTRTEEIESLSL